MSNRLDSILNSIRLSYKPRFQSLLSKTIEAKDSKDRSKAIAAASYAWSLDDFDKAIEILNTFLSKKK